MKRKMHRWLKKIAKRNRKMRALLRKHHRLVMRILRTRAARRHFRKMLRKARRHGKGMHHYFMARRHWLVRKLRKVLRKIRRHHRK